MVSWEKGKPSAFEQHPTTKSVPSVIHNTILIFTENVIDKNYNPILRCLDNPFMFFFVKPLQE